MITFEIIRDKGKLLEYRGCWNHMFDRGSYEASTSFEWTKALVDTHLKNCEFFLIVLKNSRETVGIIPTIIQKTKKYGLSLSRVSPISELYNTHSDILIQDLSEEIIEAYMKALFSLGRHWDVFTMRRLVEDSLVFNAILSYLNKTNARYRKRRTEPSYFLRLEGTFEDYLKKRTTKFRNYLSRINRKIRDKGNITIATCENHVDFEDTYNKLLYIEKRSWKHAHGTAITCIEKQNQFYKELCKAFAERGLLHLQILHIDSEPVAYNMGLIKKEKYSYIKTSFHEEYRKFSPATVLRAKLVEGLIARGLKEFDFPAEPYEWERQWTDEVRWHSEITIYNKTYMAKAIALYNLLRDELKRDSERSFSHHDPFSVKPE